MKILVTGGAGYIGSVTVERLRSKGNEVVVLDDLVRGHRSSLDPDVPLYQGSVGDRALVGRLLKEHKIESCIHFAALTYVGESVADPARYFENNVTQGISLIRSLMDGSVQFVVLSSTAAVYGEPKEIPITEESAQWPTNPYGWSKFAMERLLESYNRAYGLKFMALRYFNASGATEHRGEDHDPETHLVPNILAAATGEKPEVPVFGNNYPTPDGTCIRDYIHVGDLANAHIGALDYLTKGGSSDCLNLGTGLGYSVLEVVEAARRVARVPIRIRMEKPRPGDPAVLVADSAKAQRVLGWKPVMSDLDSILRSQWEWRQRHPRGFEDEGQALSG